MHFEAFRKENFSIEMKLKARFIALSMKNKNRQMIAFLLLLPWLTCCTFDKKQS